MSRPWFDLTPPSHTADSWEERMAARAWQRSMDEARAEQDKAEREDPEPDYRDWIGVCDICGETFQYVSYGFAGDTYVDVESDRVYVLARHYATAPPGVDPRCAIYGSRAYASD